MDLNLTGKVIVATGAASGIGRATAELLIEEGAAVIGLDQSAEGPPGCEMIQLNLGDDDACADAADRILRHHKMVNGLINCAGRNDVVGLQAGPQQFRRSVDVSLTHYYTMVHHLRSALIAGRGAIVNVASKTALTGQGGTSGYAAAKAGQLGLTREWAVELAPFGVRVNAVLPAEVMTPMYAEWLTNFEDGETMRTGIENSVPLGQRMTTPAEIASTVVFLISDRSSHTTGQWIHVDGGYIHLDRRLTQ